MTNEQQKLYAVTGPVAVGSSVITVGSLVLAVVATVGGDHVVARVCLAATALSFGLLANAVLLGARLSYREQQGGSKVFGMRRG